MPKIIEVEQNTPAWHEYRLKHLGASEVAAVMNCDPFGTRPPQAFGLWMIKSGRKKASTYQNESQAHGHKNEEAAREAYIKYAGEFAVATTMECTRPGWEFMSASLDGLHADGKTLVEIKCPQEAGTMRDVKDGQLPDNYYAQVQAQLFVSEAEKAHFFCWFRGEGVCIVVEPDPPYLATELLPEVEEFWKRVQRNEWPMPAGDAPDSVVGRPEFKVWAQEMAGVIQMEREVSDKRLRLEQQGARHFFANYQKISGHGIEVRFAFKGGYTEKKPRSIADSLSCTIRRTE